MKKLRLSDCLRCQCGWEWQGNTDQTPGNGGLES